MELGGEKSAFYSQGVMSIMIKERKHYKGIISLLWKLLRATKFWFRTGIILIFPAAI